jgi:hypothetical protein
MTRLPTSAKAIGIWPWETKEMSVSITIYDVPESLVREFAEKVVRPMYSGGVSDAIKDLMRKAILEYSLNSGRVEM